MAAFARLVSAAVLALHGTAHLIGFAVPFGLMETGSNPYTTKALWGAFDVGDAGARVLGIAFLALVLPWLAAAYGIARRRSWARSITLAAAAASAVICALASPNAVAGLVLNLAIIVFALVAPWLGARARPPA